MKERDRVLTKERRKGKARFEDEHQSISSVDEGQFEASITSEDLYNSGGVLAGRTTPTTTTPLTQSAGTASIREEGATTAGATRTGGGTNTTSSSSSSSANVGNISSREQSQSAIKKRTSFPIGGHLANMLNLSPHRRRPSLQTRLSGNLSSAASPASASSTTPSSAGGNSVGGASSSGGGVMSSIVGAGAVAGAIGSGGGSGGGSNTSSFGGSGSHGNNGDSTGGSRPGSDQPVSGRLRSSISQATPSSATTSNTATPTTTTTTSLSSLSSLSSSSTPRSSSISSNSIITTTNLANLRTLRSPGATSMTAFASTSVSSLPQGMDRLGFKDSPTTPGFESPMSARSDDGKYQRRYAGSYTMPATFDEDWDSVGEDDEDGHNSTNRIADAQRILSSSTSIQDDGVDRDDRYPAYKLEDARHIAKSRSNSTTSSRDPFADKSNSATPVADTRHSRRLGQTFDLHPSQRALSDVSLSHSASEPPSRPGSVPPRPGQQISSNKFNKENDSTSTSTPSASSSLRASSLNQIAALKQQRAAENPPRSSSSNSSSEALSIASKSPSLLHKDTHRSKTAARTAQLYEKRHPQSLEPPLPDPLAPKVDPAPSSGMYWYRTPSHGLETVPVRAHTCTLVGSSIFVFGGCDSKSCFNDLTVFDADSMFWSRPQTHGDVPPPLRAMTATAVGKKIVIFGGGDGPTYYNDLYILDTVTHRYTKPKVSGTLPSKRRAHTACLYKSGLYIFGGGDGVRALNDVWRLDVADLTKISWKLISSPTSSVNMSERSASATSLVSSNVSATPSTTLKLKPTARGYHTANMVQNKLIIFGGSDGVECFRDVWVFDVEIAVWKCVEIKASFPRLSHTSTIIGSYLFVVGGHDGAEYSNEVLLLNLVTMQWDRRKVYGKPPSGRGYHGAVLHDSRLFVIGGFDGHSVFNDTYVLELAVSSYYSQISHFTIEV